MQKRLLVGIILLAFLLRVPFLETFPAGFTPDEASFGYDAYSLLKTGKDQWGRALPLYLESFGDFKPPLYAYLTVPSVALFGLTKFATRLPSGLIGTAAVYVVFLLTKEFYRFGFSRILKRVDADIMASITALLLAVSPWHVQLSRGAYEANLTAFLMPLGIYFFLKGQKERRYLSYSALVFGLNIFSYHSARLVTPLMVGFLIFIFADRKDKLKFSTSLRSAVEKYKTFILIFGAFLALAGYTFFQGAGRRVEDVSIFRGALEEQADARLAAIESGMSPEIARIFHNKYLVVINRFFNSYKQYISLEFLFESGAGEATYGMALGMGVLYWFELPLLLGFLILLVRKRQSRVLQLILFWILASPIPAGLTTGVGYAGNRAAVMLPILQIASAIGFAYYYQFVKESLDKKSLRLFSVGASLVILVFLLSFVRHYLNSQITLSKAMLDGNLQSSYWLAENAGSKAKVIVSTRLSEPHIYIAFANKWDPKNYHIHTTDWGRYMDEGHTFLDQLHRYNLGKYFFQKIENEDLQNPKSTLLVGKPDEFPDGLNVIQTFAYPDGEEAILIAEPYGNVFANSRMRGVHKLVEPDRREYVGI